MAKATVKDIYPVIGNGLAQGAEREPTPFSDSFLIHIQEFSPHLYVFMAKDFTHDLLCEMTLEVKQILVSLAEEEEESAYFAPAVACRLPRINLEKLNEKTGFDGYLQDLLRGQFQLKILEQLLLFCGQEDAVNLILTANDADLDYLNFYRLFLVSEEQVAASSGEETQIVIPTDAGTYDKVVDFMDKIDREFRCALWREQSVNPAFRDYLISNACV